MARALTSKTVETFKANPTRRQEIPDPALSGLYLIVQPSGAKSWALRYRFAGKPKKLTLGRWPVMSLADARSAASEAIEAVGLGNDPGAAKKRAKLAKMEAHLSERDKVKTLIEQYSMRHLINLKSGKTVKRELERHVVEPWGERDIQDIAKRDVIDLLDDIVDSGRAVTANRVRAYLSKFFGWCVERDILNTSPIIGIRPVILEKSRERTLTDQEICWFWNACEAVGSPWGPLGKLLLLTGQRLGEVVAMTKTEINGTTWRLPSDRTKNGRAHDVPLSPTAQDVLDSIDTTSSQSGLYHTTNDETPLSGFHKGKKQIAKKMSEIASLEAGQPVDIEHWTFHDLRRTCATTLERLGFPINVTEAVLNHVSGSKSGIVAVYQRHQYSDEKRKALEAWARFVAATVDADKPKVIEFRSRK